MKGHVAFDLLKHLMNVAVENRYRTKALQVSKGAFAIAGPPAPLRVNRPKRDMRKHYNWSVRTQPFYIRFEPLELLVAKLAQAAGLKIKDVDQANEMNAVLIEAIPT